ncbi:MAG TPA: hypothetical protein VMM17_05385 [Gemmatimonadaceae bacterium]|nr:hypothetical protein [Gemmatimonadaceae bacterium]
MSATFAQQLRVQGDPLQLAKPGDDVVHLRVEVPEVWDTVGVEASPDEAVRVVKIHALERLQGGVRSHESYVVKLRGMEVLDESASLRDLDVRDGSTLLITSRRRRPVR